MKCDRCGRDIAEDDCSVIETEDMDYALCEVCTRGLHEYCEGADMKPLVWISQPMRGRSAEKIAEDRARVEKRLEAFGYRAAPMPEKTDEPPLKQLARSISRMADCKAAYFTEGWKDARECRAEHQAACAYDMCVFEEILDGVEMVREARGDGD